jgi:hypothetical protein
MMISSPRQKRKKRLRVLAGMEPATIKATTAGFTKNIHLLISWCKSFWGPTPPNETFWKSKAAPKTGTSTGSFGEYYTEYSPYLAKLDILGMAERKVLQIPAPMIDPNQRNTLAFFSRFHVTAYNKNLLGSNTAPRSWEDLLKPEWKGRKFTLDITPTGVASLVPAWGLEKTLEFARKLAAQQPVWVRGGIRALSMVQTGEVPLTLGINFSQLTRVQSKDASRALQYVIFEPVPVRLSGLQGIQATSQSQNAALLWLEWMASLEAQKMADDHEPLGSSVFVRGRSNRRTSSRETGFGRELGPSTTDRGVGGEGSRSLRFSKGRVEIVERVFASEPNAGVNYASHGLEISCHPHQWRVCSITTLQSFCRRSKPISTSSEKRCRSEWIHFRRHP